MATIGREGTATARRRFTVLDGMVLVAATAFGCGADAWLGGFIEDQWGQATPDLLRSFFRERKFDGMAVVLMLLAGPVAGAWTLALIPLRLARPRPSLRRLARQPGWMASCAFALALVSGSVVVGLLMAVIEGRSLTFLLQELSPLVPLLVAPAIVAAWLALVLNRRWRPEPSWVDRAGRALGVYWIAASIVGPVLVWRVYL
jgi:hypothetical protein